VIKEAGQKNGICGRPKVNGLCGRSNVRDWSLKDPEGDLKLLGDIVYSYFKDGSVCTCVYSSCTL